jgi:hypothetical protein
VRAERAVRDDEERDGGSCLCLFHRTINNTTRGVRLGQYIFVRAMSV